ncbi:hypothetical protein Anas_09686 [Armadillidium nasatum]|uniref:Uncharacterized protein n=1 Tax=Armadillidium nasatum TaxID=96803 RepID=A0A5N5SZA3_9CRUS|nr:hypothetical protein Anas_09686 [Armadillidium nasatum]
MPRLINIPKIQRKYSAINYFERRDVNDYGFTKSLAAILKYVQMSIQILFILFFANSHKILNDGILALAIGIHILSFLLNCIPLVAGVVFKNRRRIIVHLELCNFFILLIFILWIYDLVKEADSSNHLYYDYSYFYHLSSKNKVSFLFARKLTFCEALIVLLPIILTMHFLGIPFEIVIFKYLETEIQINAKLDSNKVTTSDPGTPTSRFNKNKSYSLNEFINARKVVDASKKITYPVDFPRPSKSPTLSRISETSSRESIEMRETERVWTNERESTHACESSDNVKYHMSSMETLYTERSNLTNESSDSGESSSIDVEIDSEKGVVGYKRSDSLKKRYPQETLRKLESSTQGNEREESEFQYSTSLDFDPLKHDTQEIVKPLDKGRKFIKASKKNYCDIKYSRPTGNINARGT